MGKAAGGGGGHAPGPPAGELEGVDGTGEPKPQEGAPTSPGGKAPEEKRYLPLPPCHRKLGSGPPRPDSREAAARLWGVNLSQHSTDDPPPPTSFLPPLLGRTHRRSFLPPKHPESRAQALPGPRPRLDDHPPSPDGGGPAVCCFAYANKARGRRGRPRVVPPVGPLGPGRRSPCLLSRSLFLCAAFRGIKADTVVTRSPAGQRSDFTIPITMISNDVYLAGSDGWELYKRAPLPSPLLGGPWVRGALASALAGGRCAPPGYRAVGDSGFRPRPRAPSAPPLWCSRPRRN